MENSTDQLLASIGMIVTMSIAAAALISIRLASTMWVKNDKNFKVFYAFLWFCYLLAAYVFILLYLSEFKEPIEFINLYNH